ncbi:MAG: hypothetical protein IT287_00680 [Bdellovibrionaceae bacterium]|nr:hypothetical protein [Pseudobdellovibrionaceae bacterium]
MKVAVILCLLLVFKTVQAAVPNNSKESTQPKNPIIVHEISDEETFDDEAEEELALTNEDIQFLDADENKLLAYANILKRQAKAEIDLFGSVQGEIMDELENVNEDIEYNEADEDFLKASLEPKPIKPKIEARAPTKKTL